MNTTITNRQRVLNAVNFQPNDRAPHDIWFTQDMHEKMAAHLNDPHFMNKMDLHIHVETMEQPFTEVRPGFFADEFGVVWNRTRDKDIGVIESIAIPDITEMDDFAFPPVDEAFIRAQLQRLADDDGTKLRVADLGFSLFERAWTLLGMEDLLCSMLTEPEYVHRLMRKICDRNMVIVRIAMEYDIDAFLFGDDWGQQNGLIMGPSHWREFIKPYVAEHYAYVRGHGKYTAQHSCGDIREIMDDLIDLGLNIYQTFQPEIYGLDYAEKLVNRLTIWGGISTQADLPYKTPDEIRDITRRTLAAFSKGGLIAAPTHSVPGDVPPENLLAMLDVLKNQ